MKKLTKEEELQLLYECINAGGCDKLVKYYWRPVYFMVRKSFLNRHAPLTEEELEDLRSEVFVQLFDKDCRKLRQYKEDMGLSLRNWIKMIADQAVKMYLRKPDRPGRLGPYRILSLDKLQEELGLESEAPKLGKTHSQVTEDIGNLEKYLDAREELTQTLKNIENLPPFEQFVLKLHFFDGLSPSEIAKHLGREIGNIYTIKSRAVSRLKSLMFDV